MKGVILNDVAIHTDKRGSLVELYRLDEAVKLYKELEADPIISEMSYMSWTLPGEMRGPHEHREQTDYFFFTGPGDFRLYVWNNAGDSEFYDIGHRAPRAVIIEPGIVHAYENISDVPGLVTNFPNKLYRGWNKSKPVDEIRHENDPNWSNKWKLPK